MSKKQKNQVPAFSSGSSKLLERPLASLSLLSSIPIFPSFFSPVVPQWLHGPPEREDGPTFPAALAVGEGVEGRSGVDDDEGDEKCESIFGVVVGKSGGAIAVAIGAATGIDIENAHPNAPLE